MAMSAIEQNLSYLDVVRRKQSRQSTAQSQVFFEAVFFFLPEKAVPGIFSSEMQSGKHVGLIGKVLVFIQKPEVVRICSDTFANICTYTWTCMYTEHNYAQIYTQPNEVVQKSVLFVFE